MKLDSVFMKLYICGEKSILVPWGIVQPGMYFQKVKFYVFDYNLRHTPHTLIFAHGYAHVSVHICTNFSMATITIILHMV